MHWCIVYLDDIIIFSATPEEHLVRLEAVFKKLAAAGLKLKPSKCEFFKKEITYLGHLISKEGVATDPKKVEVILNWEAPKTVYHVRSFLGFAGYYRKYIDGFSKIVKPITNLTRGLESTSSRVAKKTMVEWGELEQEAFQKLKDCFMTAPILAYADYTLPFILHTDSSEDGLGAILYQIQGGIKRVVSYASRSVSKSESRYPPHKLEFLALKWAVTEKFNEYLYGGNVFDVYTDNNPLTYVLTTAKLDACGHRWVASLANYNFNLHYKPGVHNADADAMSRMGWPKVLSTAECDELVEETTIGSTSVVNHLVTLKQPVVAAICQSSCFPYGRIETFCHSAKVIPKQLTQSVQSGMTKDDWVQLQREDPILKVIVDGLQNKNLRKRHITKGDCAGLKHYLRMQGQLRLREGVLYRRTYTDSTKLRSSQYQVVLPASLQPRALIGCHDGVGHVGRDKTLGLLRERFYWNTMHADALTHVKNCSRCLKRKSTGDKVPMEIIHVTQPLELVHMDFLKIEPSKGNVDNVLVITDHFTRYAQAYPSKTQTAQATAKLLWDNFIVHYGFPEKFISDQGRNFESQVVADLCKIAGVKKVRTTPYHPQTNGQCERFNHTLLNMLGTLSPEDKEDWKVHTSSMTHAYNCTKNASTNYSPYYLMFGRHP
ncbi:MAG: RNase H-like domain-containing protein, partial [Nitrosomonadaceae bacterium]